MNAWHQGPMAMFDLETSGVQTAYDRAVTAAVITVEPGTKPVVHEWLINPGIEIPQGAIDVHHITNEVAAGGADPAGAMHEIADLLLGMTSHGYPVVGHNVIFDLSMLYAELVRHGSPLAERVATIAPVIDTMVLDKWIDPYRPKEPTSRRPDPAKCGSRKLIDTCRVWGVELSEAEAHGATADALAAGRLAWKMAQATPGLQVPAMEVHRSQIDLKREQADSFGAYLVKQGKPDDVAREWPVSPLPQGWTPDALPVERVAS